MLHMTRAFREVTLWTQVRKSMARLKFVLGERKRAIEGAKEILRERQRDARKKLRQEGSIMDSG